MHVRLSSGRAGRNSDSGGSADGGHGRRGIQFFSVLQGVGLTFVLALASALVIGLVVAWTPTWDASDTLLKTINVLAVAAGGMYAGKKARRMGWFHGALSGLVYMLLVTWMVGPDFSVAQLATVSWLQDALLAAGAGAVGGVLGVAG